MSTLRKISLSLFIFLLNISFTRADNCYFIDHDKDKIHITAYFTESEIDDDSIANLYIPQKIWGTKYSQQFENIKIVRQSFSKHLNQSFTKNSDVKVEYDIINISPEIFSDDFGDKNFHYIHEDKFLLMGIGAFISPISFEKKTIDEFSIYINSKINVASNIKPYIKTKVVKKSFKELDDIILLGSTSLVLADENNLKVIIWSNEQNLQKRVDKFVNETFKQFIEFWQLPNLKNEDVVAIVAINPLPQDNNNWGGTVFKKTIFAGINSGLNTDTRLKKFFQHEFQHLIFSSNVLNGPTWFTEGFSDYYRDKINLLFVGNKKEFKSNYQETLESYFDSSYKNISDAEIDKYFFDNRHIEKLPYKKGYLIAAQLDLIVNLDDIIRVMYNDCITKKECIFNYDNFIKHVGKITEDDQLRIKRLIEDFNSFPQNELLPITDD